MSRVLLNWAPHGYFWSILTSRNFQVFIHWGKPFTILICQALKHFVVFFFEIASFSELLNLLFLSFKFYLFVVDPGDRVSYLRLWLLLTWPQGLMSLDSFHLLILKFFKFLLLYLFRSHRSLPIEYSLGKFYFFGRKRFNGYKI